VAGEAGRERSSLPADIGSRGIGGGKGAAGSRAAAGGALSSDAPVLAMADTGALVGSRGTYGLVGSRQSSRVESDGVDDVNQEDRQGMRSDIESREQAQALASGTQESTWATGTGRQMMESTAQLARTAEASPVVGLSDRGMGITGRGSSDGSGYVATAPWHLAEATARLGPSTPRLLAASERCVLSLLNVLRSAGGGVTSEHAHACFARGLVYRERTAALTGSAASVRRERELGLARLWREAEEEGAKEAAGRAAVEAEIGTAKAQAQSSWLKHQHGDNDEGGDGIGMGMGMGMGATSGRKAR